MRLARNAIHRFKGYFNEKGRCIQERMTMYKAVINRIY